MESCPTKHYSDACVQTSPIAPATCLEDSFIVQTTPAPNRHKRVTYFDGSSTGTNYNDSGSRRVYPRTPINRLKADSTRDQPDQAPSSGSPPIVMEAQRRVVSLPEQLGHEALSQRLARSLVATSRNVSMPAVIEVAHQSGLTHGESPSTDLSTSFSYEQFYSQTSDTLSLPSTPNSVEIVDCSFHFSDSFLRSGNKPTTSNENVQKDWLTWSNSPPRPIPALHGPASLPYARCPSGAEGTIIEQPSSVPGLIWGLKDAVTTNHPKQISSNDTADSATMQISCDGQTSDTADRRKLSPTVAPRITCKGETDGRKQTETSPAENLGTFPALPPSQPPSQPLLHAKHASGISISSARASDTSILVNLDEGQDSRTGSTRCDHSDDILQLQKVLQIPDSLLHAILRGGQLDDGIYPGDSAAAFASRPVKANSEHFATSNLRQNVEAHQGGTCILRRENSVLQNALLTPPESSSPPWTTGPSRLATNRPVGLQPATYRNASELSAMQLHGLNLQIPSDSLGGLSEQFRRLALHQQSNVASANVPARGRDPTPRPIEARVSQPGPNRPRSFTLPNTIAPRPEMPINLHNLVARHMQEQDRVEATLDLQPTMKTMPLSSGPGIEQYTALPTRKAETCQPLPSSESMYDNGSDRGDALSGKRHPRSIPLTRLLEKKLATVPEETSYTSNASDVPIPAKRSVPTPIITSAKVMKKEYDFAELRSPLEETMAEAVRLSHAGVPEDRRVLEPAKQRQRMVEQKARDEMKGGKKIPKRLSERKKKGNDENIHDPNPSATTSKKQSRPGNKRTANAVAATGKRTYGPQKAWKN